MNQCTIMMTPDACPARTSRTVHPGPLLWPLAFFNDYRRLSCAVFMTAPPPPSLPPTAAGQAACHAGGAAPMSGVSPGATTARGGWFVLRLHVHEKLLSAWPEHAPAANWSRPSGSCLVRGGRIRQLPWCSLQLKAAGIQPAAAGSCVHRVGRLKRRRPWCQQAQTPRPPARTVPHAPTPRLAAARPPPLLPAPPRRGWRARLAGLGGGCGAQPPLPCPMLPGCWR